MKFSENRAKPVVKFVADSNKQKWAWLLSLPSQGYSLSIFNVDAQGQSQNLSNIELFNGDNFIEIAIDEDERARNGLKVKIKNLEQFVHVDQLDSMAIKEIRRMKISSRIKGDPVQVQFDAFQDIELLNLEMYPKGAPVKIKVLVVKKRQ